MYTAHNEQSVQRHEQQRKKNEQQQKKKTDTNVSYIGDVFS